MKRTGSAFTLVELMIVMVIIGFLLAILLPEVAPLINAFKVMRSRWELETLCTGVDKFKQVYGEFPHDTIWWDTAKTPSLRGYPISSAGAADFRDPEYLKTQGDFSLWLSLQGPEGLGWKRGTGTDPVGPLGAGSGKKDFGPFPESPSNVGVDQSSGRRRFVDPFGRPVLYYKARLSWNEDISGSIGTSNLPRYIYQVCQSYWSPRVEQSGANESSTGIPPHYMNTAANHKYHWQCALTASKTETGRTAIRLPKNPKTYLIWMAGGDTKFGFWQWSDQHNGYIVDPDPEDPTDGVAGVCDDVTNF